MKKLLIYTLFSTVSLISQAQSAMITYDYNNSSGSVTNSHASVTADDTRLFEESSPNSGSYNEIQLGYTFDSVEPTFGAGPKAASTYNQNSSSSNKYFSISVTINAGWQIAKGSVGMTLNHISLSDEYQLHWALFSPTESADHSPQVGGSNSWNLDQNLVFPVPLENGFYNAGDTLEFRLYATARDDFQDVKPLDIDNVRISFDASLAPEPSSSALLGIGFLGALLRRSR